MLTGANRGLLFHPHTHPKRTTNNPSHIQYIHSSTNNLILLPNSRKVYINSAQRWREHWTPHHWILPTAASLICCSSAGTLHSRPRALRGVSVLSQWTMTTLATNASADTRGQCCKSPAPAMNFIHDTSISLFLSLLLSPTWVCFARPGARVTPLTCWRTGWELRKRGIRE